MLPFVAALAASIVLGTTGQLLLKSAAAEGTFAGQLLSVASIVGLAFFGGSAFCYMYAIRKIPISVALPSVSLSYVLIAFAAHWLYGEPLDAPKLAGIALIVAGVILVARQAQA